MIGLAALLGAATVAYAEPAPVYDADDLESGGGYADQQPSAPSAPSSSLTPSLPKQSLSLSQRVARLEDQANGGAGGGDSGVSARVESLQAQVQTLRDQVEQLTHKLEQMQTEQKALFSDLDNRVAKLSDVADQSAIEQSPVLPKPAKKANVAKNNEQSVDSQPDIAEEQQIYQTAYTLIKDKKYDDAVSALQTMLKKYPRGQFASNAHYWLGELYGLLGKHDKSLGEFVIVVSNYPKSPRVSDAQLKIGLIFASQSKWTEAKSAFKKVINTYPGTASSRLASEQLKQIDKAGH